MFDILKPHGYCESRFGKLPVFAENLTLQALKFHTGGTFPRFPSGAHLSC